MDEIIKYNQFTTEFNYMQEVSHRFINNLMPETKRQQRPDWAALFFRYDTDEDGLLTKKNVAKMMADAGMTHATDAEEKFVFSVIAKYKLTCPLPLFQSWGQMMEGKTQKKLILYTQYLNTVKMCLEQPKS